MRLFASLPFPVYAQEQVANYIHSLVPVFGRARPSWVPRENLHLTLHFFGEIESQTTIRLQALLADAAHLCPPLHVSTAKLSILPSLKAPRVLYIATEIRPAEPLAELVVRLRGIAAQIGAEVDTRPWKAHLTIARFRIPWAPELVSLPEPPKLAFPIDAFELMQSRLDRSGAVYSVLDRYPLAGR